MYPVIVEFWYIKIYSYGFFLALGFLIGIIVLKKEAKRIGTSIDFIYDIIWIILLFSIIGARLLYVINNWGFYSKNILSIFKLWEGGLVFYGGILLGFAALFYYLKKRKLNLNVIGDIIAPSLAVGHAIGRIGCFMAGCCYGKGTDSVFSIIFKHENTLAPIGIKLYPTQLYEAIINFSIFLYLWKIRTRKKFNGEIMFSYIALYSLLRFILEFLRGDDRGQVFIFSITQLIAIILFIIGIYFLYEGHRKNRI